MASAISTAKSARTNESTTDPDAKLFRKGHGQPAKLCFMGQALMENRSGLVVQAHLGQASGTAARVLRGTEQARVGEGSVGSNKGVASFWATVAKQLPVSLTRLAQRIWSVSGS
jgi:hypothetical protein